MIQQTATASVKVDGDKLAEALRRVSPFMADESPLNLAGVYAESQVGTLQLTASDGYRMAHLTVALLFPDGNFLMKGQGVKDFSTRHYNGAEVEVRRTDALPDSPLLMGDVSVDLEQTPYINYPDAVPDNFDTEAIIDTKTWIKPIRQHKPEQVGVVYSSAGCLMFLQSHEGETVACESLPVQMFSGPDKKVAYNAGRFRRALTSCGAGATVQVGDPARPTLFEAEDYWHILMPVAGFPREIAISNSERESIKWAVEALEAVRKGEAPGLVLIGGGKFYLQLDPGRAVTEIRLEEPRLAGAAAAPAQTQVATEEKGDKDDEEGADSGNPESEPGDTSEDPEPTADSGEDSQEADEEVAENDEQQ